jgi:hypothetical protein
VVAPYLRTTFPVIPRFYDEFSYEWNSHGIMGNFGRDEGEFEDVGEGEGDTCF